MQFDAMFLFVQQLSILSVAGSAMCSEDGGNIFHMSLISAKNSHIPGIPKNICHIRDSISSVWPKHSFYSQILLNHLLHGCHSYTTSLPITSHVIWMSAFLQKQSRTKSLLQFRSHVFVYIYVWLELGFKVRISGYFFR